jgi:uncharacterized lipoprotein YehR (DUF1307 family)
VKKLIASLLMVAMVVGLSFSLVGCGGKGTTKGTGATPSGTPPVTTPPKAT